MLQITIPPVELFDEAKKEFVWSKSYELQLEHSLVSLSKWESTWGKAFLTKGEKTSEETMDYIRCMTVSQNIDPVAYTLISQVNIDKITQYIDHPMTATKINQDKGTTNKDIITAEIVYHWMITFNIPFECQKWHLNRLLTLINVCNIKNQPQKKVNRKDILSKRNSLNEARKAQYKTSG